MSGMYKDPKEKLESVRRRLAILDQERAVLLDIISTLDKKTVNESTPELVRKESAPQQFQYTDNKSLSQQEKISLFRSLFRGREDIYAVRFESARTGKSGYQSACKNEWIKH